jgi:hypothetical protein
MRFIQYIIFLIFMGFHVLQAGEYADAFLLGSQHPHAQSLGFSSVAASVSSGHAMNNPAGFGRITKPRLNLAFKQFGDRGNTDIGE